jgi:hypothetical protein
MSESAMPVPFDQETSLHDSLFTSNDLVVQLTGTFSPVLVDGSANLVGPLLLVFFLSSNVESD